MMKKAITIVLFLSTTILYAENPKNLQPALSEPIAVIKEKGFYVGVGVGYFELENHTVDESLSSSIATAIVGYDFNSYLSVEARYSRGIRDLRYKTTSSQSINSSYSNLAIYAKAGYPVGYLKPYILIGYGINTISNLAGRDRDESSMQYGVGLSYRATEAVSAFVDYIKVYDRKGFDGRSSADKLSADIATIGITYHF